MKMYVKLICPLHKSLLLVLILAMTITPILSCQSKEMPPPCAIDVLNAMLSAQKNLPDGQYRYLKASPQSKQALTSELLSAMYGEMAREWISKSAVMDDVAMYISNHQHPFEVVVFRCTNEEDVYGGQGSVYGICQGRIDAVQRAWSQTAYKEWVENALVFVRGQYVMVVITQDPQPLCNAAKKAIR